MNLADRIGAWTLRHPEAVLGAFACVGGFTLGVNAVGLPGGFLGLLMAVAISVFLGTVDAPPMGPHQ